MPRGKGGNGGRGGGGGQGQGGHSGNGASANSDFAQLMSTGQHILLVPAGKGRGGGKGAYQAVTLQPCQLYTAETPVYRSMTSSRGGRGGGYGNSGIPQFITHAEPANRPSSTSNFRGGGKGSGHSGHFTQINATGRPIYRPTPGHVSHPALGFTQINVTQINVNNHVTQVNSRGDGQHYKRAQKEKH